MKCPSCGSARVFPSRSRNVLERVRQAVTGRQPYRCHQCGWRKWNPVLDRDDSDSETRPEDLRTGRRTAPVESKELDELDRVRSRR